MGELKLKRFSAQGHGASNLMILWKVLAVITKAVSLLPDPVLYCQIEGFDFIVHMVYLMPGTHWHSHGY